MRFDVGLDTHTTHVIKDKLFPELRFDVGLDTHTTLSVRNDLGLPLRFDVGLDTHTTRVRISKKVERLQFDVGCATTGTKKGALLLFRCDDFCKNLWQVEFYDYICSRIRFPTSYRNKAVIAEVF